MSSQASPGSLWMDVTENGDLMPTDGRGGASTSGTFLLSTQQTVIRGILVRVTHATNQGIIRMRRQNQSPSNTDSNAIITLNIEASTVTPKYIPFGAFGIIARTGEASSPTSTFTSENGAWSFARGGSGASGLEYTVYFDIIQ